jgi:peptidyl-prolyl cis-trans isomerase-like 4
VVLEMIGDLPEADAKPPDNQLFVCKLNPVTSDEDLEIIFSRFGRITQCDIIRDYKTGDSLCYAFITFEEPTSAEAAYFKMDNALIDDRRVHVDFSQSMHDLWRQFKRHGKGGGRAENAQYADEDRQGGGRGGGGRGTGGRGGRGGGRGERQLEYKSGLGPVVLAGGGGGYAGEGRGGGERQPPRAPGERRDGDWPCPRCGNNCYAFRTECNRCQTPKGAVVEAAPQRAAPPPPQQQQYRPAPPPPPPRHADDGGRERDERERRRSRSREPRERRRSRSRERERRRSRSRSGERKKKHHSRKHSRSRSRDRSRR